MARSKDRLIQVEVYGQRYSLRAEDETDARHVEQLAAHVDRKMREIAQTTPTVDSFKVAVLAAVNIADEMYRARDEARDRDSGFAQRAEELERMLDLVLAEGAPEEFAEMTPRSTAAG